MDRRMNVGDDEKTSRRAARSVKWLEAAIQRRRGSNFHGSLIVDVQFLNGQINVVKTAINQTAKDEEIQDL